MFKKENKLHHVACLLSPHGLATAQHAYFYFHKANSLACQINSKNLRNSRTGNLYIMQTFAVQWRVI